MEGVDELAASCKQEIGRLTDQAMNGQLTFEEVFRQRLEIIQPNRKQVRAVGARYIEQIVPWTREVVDALQSLGKNVWIVSGGIQEAVDSFAEHLNIPTKHIRAISLHHDEAGQYAGFDSNNPLTRNGGKAIVLEEISRIDNTDRIVLVGDGATDLEAAGQVARFIAFGAVVRRETVFAAAKFGCESPTMAGLLPLILEKQEIELVRQRPNGSALVAAAENEHGGRLR